MKEGQLLQFCLSDGTCLKAVSEKGRNEEEKEQKNKGLLSETSFKDLPYYNIAQQLTLSIQFFIFL